MPPIRCVAALAAACLLGPAQAQAVPQSHRLQHDFATAARELEVPAPLLLAVAYDESRWDTHRGAPSTVGGYGVMHLTDLQGALDGSGKLTQLPPSAAFDPANHTAQTAAGLIGAPLSAVRTDARQNVRAGAALLAAYARDLGHGRLPGELAGWYGAVERYSQSPSSLAQRQFADNVFAILRAGAVRTTDTGQTVRLAATKVTPRRGALAPRTFESAPAGTTAPDCPPVDTCRFIPAAYTLNDPNDLTNYGDYDLATRPGDGLDIRYVVMHDTEESYDDTIATFTNPLSYVSAHYVIRSSDGLVTQMVPNEDVAWHAGNWFVNSHAIGIEQEGFAIQGATWFTENLYRASAALVRHLTREYGIPRDREHIVGHDDVPGILPGFTIGMHWDPGPYWDWAHFMQLLGAPIHHQGRTPGSRRVITIAPRFATNQPPVSDCSVTPPVDQPAQPASFVYLRTAPSADAPYLTDAVYGAGTTCAQDAGDKAVTGQSFVVAGESGDWTGIWFDGQEGWFLNPHRMNTAAASATVVTPRDGLASIPVYGRAYPEASAYPPGIPPQAVTPVEYTIPTGQEYVATGPIRSSYYWAPTYTLNPADHVVVLGQTRYYQVRLGHRFFFVMADDVDVVPPTG